MANPGWTPELTRHLLAELRKQSEITTALVDVLRDLRDELAHLRTARERDERFASLRARTTTDQGVGNG